MFKSKIVICRFYFKGKNMLLIHDLGQSVYPFLIQRIQKFQKWGHSGPYYP